MDSCWYWLIKLIKVSEFYFISVPLIPRNTGYPVEEIPSANNRTRKLARWTNSCDIKRYFTVFLPDIHRLPSRSCSWTSKRSSPPPLPSCMWRLCWNCSAGRQFSLLGEGWLGDPSHRHRSACFSCYSPHSPSFCGFAWNRPPHLRWHHQISQHHRTVLGQRRRRWFLCQWSDVPECQSEELKL